MQDGKQDIPSGLRFRVRAVSHLFRCGLAGPCLNFRRSRNTGWTESLQASFTQSRGIHTASLDIVKATVTVEPSHDWLASVVCGMGSVSKAIMVHSFVYRTVYTVR